jgi:hypothetical protein
MVLAVAMLPAPSRADAVLDANALLLEAVRASAVPPPMVTRQIAILNAAMFDSANAAVGLRYEPYSYDGMAIANATPDMAARAAGAAVLRALFPDLPDRVPALAARIAALGAGATTDAVADALGRACAEAILKARAEDGADAVAPPALGSSAPGAWRPEGPARHPGLLPHWGKVAPWALATTAQIRVPPPPPIGSVAWLDAFNAVKALGSPGGASHSAAFSQIAMFWADDAGTETPPGHWIAIAGELAARDGGDVVDHARLFALLGLVLADTATVVWEAKYRFAMWRPITAVREAARLGNPRIKGDPSWAPALDTPGFPEYPSGHSAFSAAAARTLARVFGRDDLAFDTGTRARTLPGVTRHFDRLSDAAEEAGLSRIYGGIHFYFSHRASVDAGNQVADAIVTTRLRPLPK